MKKKKRKKEGFAMGNRVRRAVALLRKANRLALRSTESKSEERANADKKYSTARLNDGSGGSW